MNTNYFSNIIPKILLSHCITKRNSSFYFKLKFSKKFRIFKQQAKIVYILVLILEITPESELEAKIKDNLVIGILYFKQREKYNEFYNN